MRINDIRYPFYHDLKGANPRTKASALRSNDIRYPFHRNLKNANRVHSIYNLNGTNGRNYKKASNSNELKAFSRGRGIRTPVNSFGDCHPTTGWFPYFLLNFTTELYYSIMVSYKASPNYNFLPKICLIYYNTIVPIIEKKERGNPNPF